MCQLSRSSPAGSPDGSLTGGVVQQLHSWMLAVMLKACPGAAWETKTPWGPLLLGCH